MVGLPRSIIKKYGVTKKAWQVFRGNKTTVKTKTRSVQKMARRRRTARSYARKAYKGGKNIAMNGLYSPSGMLGKAIMGIGAATIAQQIPVSIPYKEEIAAGVVGGLPGAGAVFLLKKYSGSGSSSSGGIELN